MLDRGNPYFRQVELLLRVLPLVARESCFALKGGTAINLFIRDLPRLSVDIDLAYLPLDDRGAALAAIEAALTRIADDIRRVVRGSSVNATPGEAGRVRRLQVSAGGTQIKVEVSPVLRGSLADAVQRPASDVVTEQFGYVEALVLDDNEIYAGKLVAALDRQHPRDLFDVMILLEHEGITRDLVELFVVYLASSGRPISELLEPNLIPLQPVFDRQFQGMALRPVSVEMLEATRQRVVDEIRAGLTADHKAFLRSFKAGEPEWQRLSYPGAADLPAVQWKLLNIRSMPESQRAAALARLERILWPGD